MPTGYTSAVQDGTITSLADFAMQCARAFGATITMRDDPMDAPIPERFEPSSYHAQALKRLKRTLEKLRSMSPCEAQAACQADHRQDMARWIDRCDRRGIQRARYTAMLECVRGWAPPTPDHEGLKEFMVKQISDSLAFDCTPWDDECMPSIKRWPQWLAEKIRHAQWEIDIHKRGHSEDVGRAATRTTWVRDLRASLQ